MLLDNSLQENIFRMIVEPNVLLKNNDMTVYITSNKIDTKREEKVVGIIYYS